MTEKNSIDEYLEEVIKRCEVAEITRPVEDCIRLARYAQKLRETLKDMAGPACLREINDYREMARGALKLEDLDE